MNVQITSCGGISVGGGPAGTSRLDGSGGAGAPHQHAASGAAFASEARQTDSGAYERSIVTLSHRLTA